MRYTNENVREIPPYDLVVCGGGPAGVAAALSAARLGVRTLLVEAEGQLGGMGVSGMVSHWLGGRTSDCRSWVVGGIFRELAQEAASRGIALIPEHPKDGSYSPYGWSRGQLTAGIPFDPFGMAWFLDEKAAEAGIDVLFLTRVVDVVTSENGRRTPETAGGGRSVTRLFIHNKGGFASVSTKAVVDATGDADVAALAGCDTVLGRESDRLMTPVTLQCHMEGIDEAALAEYINRNDSPRFLSEIVELREKGEWPFPYERFITVKMPGDGTFMVNTPRITGVDGTDGASVTQGMIQGRKEIMQLLHIMRRHIPGCRNARIKAVAPLLGVRETRRIVAGFRLTVDDLVSGTLFPDTTGFSAYGWDLPDPKRPSYQPMGETKRKKRITPIPYRCMVPQTVDNLICPGRAVSVERDVLGPLRVQAPCMAMGEAAGVAAALTMGTGRALSEVDVQELRSRLRDQGAIVDEDPKWNEP